MNPIDNMENQVTCVFLRNVNVARHCTPTYLLALSFSISQVHVTMPYHTHAKQTPLRKRRCFILSLSLSPIGTRSTYAVLLLVTSTLTKRPSFIRQKINTSTSRPAQVYNIIISSNKKLSYQHTASPIVSIHSYQMSKCLIHRKELLFPLTLRRNKL